MGIPSYLTFSIIAVIAIIEIPPQSKYMYQGREYHRGTDYMIPSIYLPRPMGVRITDSQSV